MNCPFCGSTKCTKAGTSRRTKPQPHLLQQYRCTNILCYRIFTGENVNAPITQSEVAGSPDPPPLSSSSLVLPAPNTTNFKPEQIDNPCQ
jgi:hypothetical protein